MNGSWGDAPPKNFNLSDNSFRGLPCCLKGGLGNKSGILFSISVFLNVFFIRLISFNDKIILCTCDV